MIGPAFDLNVKNVSRSVFRVRISSPDCSLTNKTALNKCPTEHGLSEKHSVGLEDEPGFVSRGVVEANLVAHHRVIKWHFCKNKMA